MAVRTISQGPHVEHRVFAEALGILPVLMLLGLLTWAALRGPEGDGEAGRETPVKGLAASVSPVWQSTGVPRSVILVSPAESRSEELSRLIQSETTLREMLGEEPRRIDVLTAESADAAELIADAIRADAALPSLDTSVDVVIVP